MKFNRVLISALALAVVLPATAVQAEDWSGAYFGLSGGYSFGNIEAGAITSNSKKAKTPFFWIDRFNALDPTGFEAQAFLGYRMQSGGLVYGAEVGVSSGGVSDAVIAEFNFGESYFLRGIVGTEWQGNLIFGSLGIVSTAIEAPSLVGEQDRATGLSLGLGIEQMLNDQWGLRTEVIHTIYSDDYNLILGGGTHSMETGLSRTSVQVGAIYRF